MGKGSLRQIPMQQMRRNPIPFRLRTGAEARRSVAQHLLQLQLVAAFTSSGSGQRAFASSFLRNPRCRHLPQLRRPPDSPGRSFRAAFWTLLFGGPRLLARHLPPAPRQPGFASSALISPSSPPCTGCSAPAPGADDSGAASDFPKLKAVVAALAEAASKGFFDPLPKTDALGTLLKGLTPEPKVKDEDDVPENGEGDEPLPERPEELPKAGFGRSARAPKRGVVEPRGFAWKGFAPGLLPNVRVVEAPKPPGPPAPRQLA
eukprot:scaffold1830_cov246-Pinguiococcus_pyrenoidosus.AAC.20